MSKLRVFLTSGFLAEGVISKLDEIATSYIKPGLRLDEDDEAFPTINEAFADFSYTKEAYNKIPVYRTCKFLPRFSFLSRVLSTTSDCAIVLTKTPFLLPPEQSSSKLRWKRGNVTHF